jgi:hypothetical protein
MAGATVLDLKPTEWRSRSLLRAARHPDMLWHAGVGALEHP